MKGTLALALLVLTLSSPVAAQTRLARGDVSATLGWFNANKGELDLYEEWYSRSLAGEAGAGWYWTNNLKTEVLAGATTGVELYGPIPPLTTGQPVYAASRFVFRTRRLSVSHQYQFGDNQWFHPYLGAGIDLIWERSVRRDEPLFGYDPVTRQSGLLRPAIEYPGRTDLRTFAALSGGFKAYFTRRGFFRADLRVNLTDRPEEILLRFGFGADF